MSIINGVRSYEKYMLSIQYFDIKRCQIKTKGNHRGNFGTENFYNRVCGSCHDIGCPETMHLLISHFTRLLSLFNDKNSYYDQKKRLSSKMLTH